MTLGAAVCTELGVAADAHGPALAADEPLTPEILPTVETLRVVCHLPCEENYGKQNKRRGRLLK